VVLPGVATERVQLLQIVRPVGLGQAAVNVGDEELDHGRKSFERERQSQWQQVPSIMEEEA
jgi:hypothetical protein